MNTLTIEVKAQLVIAITKFVKETIIELMMKSQPVHTRDTISKNNQSRLYDELQRNKYNFEKAIPCVVKQLVNSGEFATYIHDIYTKELYLENQKQEDFDDTEGCTYYDDPVADEYEENVSKFFIFSMDFMGLHLIANLEEDTNSFVDDYNKECFLDAVCGVVSRIMLNR